MIKIQQLRYLIPNGFTASSMALGITSAYLSAHDQFTLAAWMITWGVLLDKLDGSAARLFNASSDFGVQFDSFADFVIFGIAPATHSNHRLFIHYPYSHSTSPIQYQYATRRRSILFWIAHYPQRCDAQYVLS